MTPLLQPSGPAGRAPDPLGGGINPGLQGVTLCVVHPALGVEQGAAVEAAAVEFGQAVGDGGMLDLRTVGAAAMGVEVLLT